MRLRTTLALSMAAMGLSLASATAQPLLRATISNFTDLSNAVVWVTGAAVPDSGKDFGAEMVSGLGLTNLAGIDLKAPWEVAVFQEAGGAQPLIAVKAPIGDIKKFQAGLDSDGLLASEGKAWTQVNSNTAAIVFRDADSQSDAEKAALKKWEGQAIVAPSRTLELTLGMTPDTRAQALALLGMVRMNMSQALSMQGGDSPKGTAEMLSLYVDVIEAFVKGLQEFKLAAGVEGEGLALDQTISAKPDSELAKWLKKPANPLTPADLKYLDPEAGFSGAMTLDKNPAMLDWLRKVTVVSLQMQGQGTNDTVTADVTQMMEKMLPMCACFSMSFNKGLESWGAYRFPGSDAAAVYSQMKPVISHLLKAVAGEGKMYSVASLTEKHHTVGSVAVDRLVMALNLDGPAFKTPGAKENMEAMFPGGKMEYDQAVKDGQWLFATTNLMAGLLAGKPAAPAAVKIDASTVAVGYVNLLGMIKQAMASNPMIPEEAKDKLSAVNAKGTAIEFQVTFDSAAHCKERLPKALLRQIGKACD